MAKPLEVLNQIQTLLQASSYLTDVVDSNILVGMRDNVVKYPTLIIELLSIREDNAAYGKQRLTMMIGIIGLVNTYDKENQFTDLLGMENNVKKALSADITQGGYAINTEFGETIYDIVEYPVRSFNIRVDILFEQTSTGRS